MNNIFRLKKILLIFVFVFLLTLFAGCESKYISEMGSGDHENITISNYNEFISIDKHKLTIVGNGDDGYSSLDYFFKVSGYDSIVYKNVKVTIQIKFEIMYDYGESSPKYFEKIEEITFDLNDNGEGEKSGFFLFNNYVTTKIYAHKAEDWCVVKIEGTATKK